MVYASELGGRTAERLSAFLKAGRVPHVVARYGQLELGTAVRCFDGLVLVLAVPGAVRALCGVLPEKGGPPVVAVDPAGRYVVPLSNAHFGGNELAVELASALGAEAVITTAAEAVGVTPVEDLAAHFHCRLVGDVAGLYSALLGGEEVCVWGVEALPPWVRGPYRLGAGCRWSLAVGGGGGGGEGVVRCVPYRVAVGVGFMREASPEEVASAVREALGRLGIPLGRVAALASVKPEVREAAGLLGVEAAVLDGERLDAVEDPCLSPPGRKALELGLRGVAERAALAAAGPGASLVMRKTAFGRVTVAVARIP